MTGEATDPKRWRGFTHEELYKMLHNGPGAPASAEPGRRWAALEAALTEIGQDLTKTLESPGSKWHGRAAGAAYGKLAPLAEWATNAATGAAELRTSLEQQADHIARARAEMPTPDGMPPLAPDPAVPPAVQVAAVQNDAEPAEAAKAAGEQKAFEVMAAYELNTTTNLATLTAFTSPPKLAASGGPKSNRGHGVALPSFIPAILPQVVRPHVDDDDERPERPRHSHFPREHGHHLGVDVSAAAPVAEPEVRRAPAAPGVMTGASAPNEILGGSPAPATRSNEREQSRSGGRPTVGAGPVSGVGAIGSVDDMASTAAANPATSSAAGQGGVAPAGAGAGAASQQDRVAMRRFGTEALGSSQWFGDNAEPVSRQLPGRRRDLASGDQVTESVSVDGEDHQLPPNVIGG